jgi:NDP-sugar pyrophosphorylase family protein
VVVTNADLLTNENFAQMVDHHIALDADATMGVRNYEMQVPFGVVRERDGIIQSIEEKPVQRFSVSAGMYVLSPATISHIPHDEYFDMPSLFDRLVSQGNKACSYRVDGYWLDIGRLPDYERANLDFNEVFQ